MNRGTIVLARAETASEDGQRTHRALVGRREGKTYEQIAEDLRCSPWEARQLASMAYARLTTESADELRAAVEDRLDGLLQALHRDLKLADSQTIRNGIYGLILKTEAQRAKLLGLDIPPMTPDEPGDD